MREATSFESHSWNSPSRMSIFAPSERGSSRFGAGLTPVLMRL